MTNGRQGVVCALCYVATIVGANWALATFGVVPVGFGLYAPAGVYFAGLAFTELGQMLPRLALQNRINSPETHAELCSKCNCSHLTSRETLPHVNHLRLGQLRAACTLTTGDAFGVLSQVVSVARWVRKNMAATLRKHIGHVRLVVPQEKMCRVDTTPIVAVVQDIQAFGDRAVMPLPRDAMRLQYPCAGTAADGAIPVCSRALPLPTRAKLRTMLRDWASAIYFAVQSLRERQTVLASTTAVAASPPSNLAWLDCKRPTTPFAEAIDLSSARCWIHWHRSILSAEVGG
jgi:hypothetical protein